MNIEVLKETLVIKMGLFSFGSKRGKVRKMLENEEMQEAVNQALKDKKVLDALIELLDDKVPGIKGDSLLILTQVMEIDKKKVKGYIDRLILKVMEVSKTRNPYVKENSMILAYKIAQEFPEDVMKRKEEITKSLDTLLEEGDKNDKAFALLMIKQLELKELIPKVEELMEVQDKVLLPFEGYKWVPLGDIAKEVLEGLK
ncbi:hypothetical protein [Palaeococcus sp. (in: euryarchaeotes)]